jgi:hypothetical protein
MRWIALVFALAAVAANAAPVADATAPCRDRIYADWDRDGKIASTYPLSCYRDALRHMPAGDSVYTSLEDDIRAALQAAVARSHGRHVAPQVGKGLPRGFGLPAKHDERKTMMDERMDPLASATTTSALPAGDPAPDGGGVPTPLIVLGALALALALAGAIGLAVRASRGSGPAA